MHITVVLGSGRHNRQSEQAFSALVSLLSERTEVTHTAVDVKDHVTQPYTIASWDPAGADTQPTEWLRIVSQTDRFIFILPEYNHSFPGEWKLLMDSLTPTQYSGKDAYVVGVSAGTFGGARVIEHVKPVLIELGLVCQKTALYVPHASNLLTDAGGAFTDAETKERFIKFVDAVAIGQ